MDGRCGCVLSGPGSRCLQKQYLKGAGRPLPSAFTETSTTERGPGIQGIELSLPPCSLSFLSKQQRHGFFSHRNKRNAESFPSAYSLPTIPLSSVHQLPSSLHLSALCYLETVHNRRQRIKSASKSHAERVKQTQTKGCSYSDAWALPAPSAQVRLNDAFLKECYMGCIFSFAPREEIALFPGSRGLAL